MVASPGHEERGCCKWYDTLQVVVFSFCMASMFVTLLNFLGRDGLRIEFVLLVMQGCSVGVFVKTSNPLEGSRKLPRKQLHDSDDDEPPRPVAATGSTNPRSNNFIVFCLPGSAVWHQSQTCSKLNCSKSTIECRRPCKACCVD